MTTLVQTFLHENLKRNKQTTVKYVLSGHLNIDKGSGLMENGTIIKVKSNAECSHALSDNWS